MEALFPGRSKMDNIGICITFSKVFDHMFLLEDIEYDLKEIADTGIKAVELSIRDTGDIDSESLIYNLKKNRLKLVTIATGLIRKLGGITLMDKKPNREIAIERITEMMDLLSKGGSREKYILIGYVKGELRKGSNREQIKIIKESLKELTGLAKEKGVKILLEVINHNDTNFLNTISEGADFISQFDSDYIKLAIDSYHMNIEEKDTFASIIKCRKHIGYVHLSDSDRAYPGRGSIDFKKILSALKEIDYRGYFMFECRTAMDKYREFSTGYKNILKIAKEIGYHV